MISEKYQIKLYMNAINRRWKMTTNGNGLKYILFLLITIFLATGTLYNNPATAATQDEFKYSVDQEAEEIDTGETEHEGVKADVALEDKGGINGQAPQSLVGDEAVTEFNATVFTKPKLENIIFNGSANYTIPVDVPPGRCGLSPKISLNYNSQGKNGILGLGWALDMGSIQRSTKWGVKYNADDFVANGKELVQKPVEWGSGYYGAKIEQSFTKYYCPNPNVANSTWVATTTDGTTYYYGQSDDSRLFNPADSSEIFKWCLDRIEDNNGNFIEITYTKSPDSDQDEWANYINTISYTGNESLLPRKKVIFHYEERDDVIISFLSKFKTKMIHRLKAIEVKNETAPGDDKFVWAYQMEYNHSEESNKSRLTSVQVFGGDGASVDDIGEVINGTSQPAIILTYQPEAGNFQNDAAHWGISPYGFIKHYADFNGDGRTDFIQTKSCLGCDDEEESKVLYVSVSNENGLTSEKEWGLRTDNIWTNSDSWEHGFLYGFGDMDGDGKTDFVYGSKRQDYQSESIEYLYADIHVMYARSSSDDSTNGYFTPDSAKFYIRLGNIRSDTTPCDGIQRNFELFDYNGDGKCDFSLKTNQNNYLCLSTGTGFQSGGSVVQFGDNIFHILKRIDMNGDRKVDTVSIRDDEIIVYGVNFLDVYNSDPAHTIPIGLFYWRKANPIVDIADMNGDGLPDFIYTPYSTNRICVLLSNGRGFEPEETWCEDHQDSWAHKIADVNGDGMADFIQKRLDGGNSIWVMLSTGNGFTEPKVWESFDHSFNGWGFYDFTGDGKNELYYHRFGTNSRYLLKSIAENNMLLSGVSENPGLRSEITYKSSAEYENKKLPFVLQTVNSINYIDIDRIDSILTEFDYSGGYYSSKEKEFWGFEEIIKTLPHKRSTIVSTFCQDEFRQGKIQSEIHREPVSEGSAHLTETTYSWEQIAPSSNWGFVKLNEKQTVFEGNSSLFSKDTYTYDPDNGFVTQIVNEGTFSDAKTTTEKVHQNQGAWLWRTERETLKDSSGNILRETEFTHDIKGNLLQKKLYCDSCLTGDDPIFRWDYDAYGNVTEEYDAENPQSTVYDYDTETETYPIKITNPKGHEVEYAYNKFGSVDWVEDVNDNRTNYYYDDFGRNTTIEYPNGGSKNIIYEDESNPRFVYSEIVENDTPGHIIQSWVYFDGFGRPIQTTANGEINYVVTTNHYDKMGRLHFAAGPFSSTISTYLAKTANDYSSGSSLSYEDTPTLETIFDYLSRPIRTIAFDNSSGDIITRIIYTKFVTTIYDPDWSKRREIRDHLGRIIQVREYLDSDVFDTKYTYSGAGDLIKIEDTLGNITTITYNSLGQKISMDDPDLREWSYTYDLNGNLITQTDAKDQTITYEYDALNRVTTKTYTDTSVPTPTVYYVYDNEDKPDQPHYNRIGRLCKVWDEDHNEDIITTTTYEKYDEIGRVLEVKKNIEGQGDKTTSTNYDYTGKVTQITYPDDLDPTVSYEYYEGSGLLKNVKNEAGEEYAIFSNYTPSGKPRQIVYLDGSITTYEYDEASHRLATINTEKDSITEFNRQYTYSPGGDIEIVAASDWEAKTWFYEYDNLHRLKSETSNDDEEFEPVVMEFTYDDTEGDRPFHAVDSIKINGTEYYYNYDLNGTLISGPDFTDPSNVKDRNAIEWFANNMPKQIDHTDGVVEFLYDGDGNRVKKNAGSTYTFYYGNHYEEIDSSEVKYIFAGNLRIAMVKDSEVSFFHKDHLGSSTVMTKMGEPEFVERTSYLPYGGKRDAADPISLTNYKFTDQEHDVTIGLYNYNARLYDPVIGQFISADSIVPDYYDPQTLNRYTYARNNPLKYTDPSGHIIWDIIDVVSFFESATSFIRNPSWANAGWLAGDTIGLAPGISGPGTIKAGVKTAGAVVDAVKKSKKTAGKLTTEIVDKTADKIVSKSGTYARPSGYRKGVKDQVWDDAIEPSTGRVRDPKTGKFMSKDKSWDMGHKPGHEFRKHQKSATERNIDRKKFLDEHNNPSKYRPELPSSNRSHAAEDMTDKYFGP